MLSLPIVVLEVRWLRHEFLATLKVRLEVFCLETMGIVDVP